MKDQIRIQEQLKINKLRKYFNSNFPSGLKNQNLSNLVLQSRTKTIRIEGPHLFIAKITQIILSCISYPARNTNFILKTEQYPT